MNESRTGVPAGRPGENQWPYLPGLCAAAALGAVYLLTMCRDLYWYDSAELAMAALQPGLSHPPGQPLHTLIGHAVARIFQGHPLLGLNALSAACAALTALPAMKLVRVLRGRTGGDAEWIAAAALVGLGMSDAVWESATRIEVYSMAGLLATWQAAHVAGIATGLHANVPPSRTDWFLAGLLPGLAASVHPYVAIFTAIVTALALAGPMLRGRWSSIRTADVALPGLALGLLPYAWIPASTLFHGSLVWGEPSTIEALSFYLRGIDYSQNRAEVLTALAQAADFAWWLAGKGTLIVLLAGAASWWIGRKARGALPCGLRLAPLAFLIPALWVIGRIGNYRPAIPDFMGYVLPATWAAGAGIAAAAAIALDSMGNRPARIAVQILVGAWVTLCAFLPPSVNARSRHDNRVARLLAGSVLTDSPSRAIVVVESDHLVFPLLYLTEVEGLRPDVVVLNAGWASSSWYWRHLTARHADVTPPDPAARGRRDRLVRFLASNGDRPVLAESLALAGLTGHPVTRSAWMLRAVSDPASDVDFLTEAERHEWARERLAGWIRDHGGPGTVDRCILAWIATTWGDDAREGGHPGDAVLDYLSGSPPVDASMIPRDLLLPAAWPSPLPPRPPLDPRFLLADPEHNLFLAGELLTYHAAGGASGLEMIEMAAGMEVEEAFGWLEASPR